MEKLEEKMTRAFKNIGYNIQRKSTEYIHKLDDVLFTLDNNNTLIEIRNLSFPWIPDFRVIQMVPNLNLLYLEVHLNLTNLFINGIYEVNNINLQQFLPIIQTGKLLITFSNVKGLGKVSLSLKEDSFIIENYDINYQFDEISIRVIYCNYEGNHQEIENEIINTHIESTIASTIWKQLKELLTNLLDKQCTKVISEFSIRDYIINYKPNINNAESTTEGVSGDDDDDDDDDDDVEPEDDQAFRMYAIEEKSKANKLIDDFLCIIKDYLVINKKTMLKIPNIYRVFKKLQKQPQGKFYTKNGCLYDLTTLSRTRNFSFIRDVNNNKFILFGNLHMKKFKCDFENYLCKYDGNEVSGGINTYIQDNVIFMKISISLTNSDQEINFVDIQVRSIKKFDVSISSLASLSWLQSKVESWIKCNLHLNAFPLLESAIKDAFYHSIIINKPNQIIC